MDPISDSFQMKPVKLDMSGRIEAATSRLNKLEGLKRKVGVVRMWPDQAVAEHENIERFRTAMTSIGVELIEVDRYGIIIGSPNHQITKDDVDFVIHLHFETGKAYDVVSVAAMWNPPRFYYDWGFEQFWANQMSHDVFAYTGSEEILGMMRASQGTPINSVLTILNHSLSDPIYTPAEKKTYKVFYCGINWEKISGKKGRHDEVLKSLDALKLISIYGPQALQGRPVWDGYNGYSGPLPFDGKTIIRKIWDCGTCLVFSSEAHIESDVMSNRLFEALAAGSVVIGDEHPFIREAIGDNYILVHSSLDPDARAKLISTALAEFNEDPAKAVAMAQAAQDHFVSKFFLCDQLVNMYETVNNYNQRLAAKLSTTECVLDLVIQPLPSDSKIIKERIENLRDKLQGRANIHLIVQKNNEEWYKQNFGEFANIKVSNGTKNAILHPFACMKLVGDTISSQKVCFLLGLEEVYPDKLISACIDLKGIAVGRLGYVIKHVDAKHDVHFDYRGGAIPLEKLHDMTIAGVVFDVAWLKSKIPFGPLSWKHICKIAEIENEGIAEVSGTCWNINLREYELAQGRGFAWVKSTLDLAKLVDLSSRTKASLGDTVVVRRLPPVEQPVIYRDLNGALMISELKKLPIENLWDLTLSLYKSVPMPVWLRKIVTFFRKVTGVK